MIHTDGRPTIANAPQRSPEVTETVVETPEGDQLLERSYAGLYVEVRWNAFAGVNTLFVRRGDEPVGFAEIKADEVLDAFEHPYVYLAAAGVSFES